VVLCPLQSTTGTGRRSPLGCGLSLGVPAPSALAIAAAHFTRVCLARYVAPPGFSRPLDALLPPRTPRPCFMPRTLVGFVPFEAFPFAERGTASRRHLAHMPSARAVERFHALPRLAPGSCSLRKSVARPESGPSGRPAAPLGFTSPGVVPHRDGGRLPGASSRGLRRGPVRAAAAPQSLDRAGVRRSPWRSPPLLRFLHLVPHPGDSRRRDPGSWFRLEPLAASLLLGTRFGSSATSARARRARISVPRFDSHNLRPCL